MTTTDVTTLIESIRSTRDKLAEEIQPQRDAIAATEAEIDRLNAMLDAYAEKPKTPKARTAKRTATAKSNGKPDEKMLERVREAHKALVKATENNEEPHELALQGFFLKADYADTMGVDPKDDKLAETLKALTDDKWETKGAARGMRYGPKA